MTLEEAIEIVEKHGYDNVVIHLNEAESLKYLEGLDLILSLAKRWADGESGC